MYLIVNYLYTHLFLVLVLFKSVFVSTAIALPTIKFERNTVLNNSPAISKMRIVKLWTRDIPLAKSIVSWDISIHTLSTGDFLLVKFKTGKLRRWHLVLASHETSIAINIR